MIHEYVKNLETLPFYRTHYEILGHILFMNQALFERLVLS